LIEAMEEKAANNNYSIFVLMLTDIYNEGSEMIVAGENKELVAKAFNKDMENDSFYVKDVLSRKKQVVPPITEIISNIEEL
jgi:manganese-dependent inorganic pyrophosphatase